MTRYIDRLTQTKESNLASTCDSYSGATDGHSHAENEELTMRPKSMVEKIAPTNPSQVFLGESLMRGVLPKKKPAEEPHNITPSSPLLPSHTKQVGHDVIAHYHGHRNNEPEYTLKGNLNDEIGRTAKEEEGQVSPCEL